MGKEHVKDRILFSGNLVFDHVYDVATYPKEDSGQRALAARKSLGGNGGNSTRVLAQLRGDRSTISWLGPVPRADEPDTRSALASLHAGGVDTSLLEEVGGEGLPTSFIISSQKTGSRTIVSTRHGVRELSPAHFGVAVRRAFDEAPELGKPCWCHLECRQAPEVMLEMVKAWHTEAGARSSNGVPPLSVEVEKPSLEPERLAPLLRLCDHAFFSREFAEAHHARLKRLAVTSAADEGVEQPAKRRRADPEGPSNPDEHVALEFLRGLSMLVGPSRALWVCTWGEDGAFALDTASSIGLHEPARKQPQVVDSVGAGDTFIAACIHARLLGADAARTLECGCAVAGRKVAQVGFDSLRLSLPADLA